MNSLDERDIYLLKTLLKEAQERAQNTLSTGLLSDDADIIGRESAILRQLDSIKIKLEKMLIDI